MEKPHTVPSCEKAKHNIVRKLTAAIPPRIHIDCHCETCGKKWNETYTRTRIIK